jgi:Domain of unknown function (DUF3387)
MTGDITKDPPPWSAAGHITTKKKREAIKDRFVEPADSLKIVIVRDMWLTGFDAPCANALYIDKPMKGHNLMQAIARYNNGAIQAADVVAVMVELRQRQQDDERRKAELGLSDEEIAFYDVIAHGAPQGIPTENEWIADLVREVVAAVHSNVKVDWTKAHRRDVYASVESAVKRVLRRRLIKGEQFRFLLARLMEQAKASYEDWPLAA